MPARPISSQHAILVRHLRSVFVGVFRFGHGGVDQLGFNHWNILVYLCFLLLLLLLVRTLARLNQGVTKHTVPDVRDVVKSVTNSITHTRQCHATHLVRHSLGEWTRDRKSVV